MRRPWKPETTDDEKRIKGASHGHGTTWHTMWYDREFDGTCDACQPGGDRQCTPDGAQRRKGVKDHANKHQRHKNQLRTIRERIGSGSGGSGMNMWDPQIEALEPYYRVLRYDMRGHGESDAPKGAYTLEQLAADAGRTGNCISSDCPSAA